jgi:F-type H+-transporting ATPase subunit epsilon
MSPSPTGRLALRIIAPRNLEVEAEVLEVSLPSLDGSLGILPGHRPMILALGRGPLCYKDEKGEERLSVQGGYAEVGPEAVLVFTELSDEEDAPSSA